MNSCLVLYHPKILASSINKILRGMFIDGEMDIQAIDNDITLLHFRDVNKTDIWQAALSFETTNIMVGYGFGKTRKEAHIKAWETILTRLKEEGSKTRGETSSDDNYT